MLQTFKNAWKVPELKSKILFTLMILLLYRIGANLFIPYINVDQIDSYSRFLSDGIFGMLSMMSGSAFSQGTFFALSVSPYITASIVIQLLSIAIPALERLSKEGGEEGKKKINRITRYTTIGLGMLMGFAYYIMLTNYNDSMVASGYTTLLTQTGEYFGRIGMMVIDPDTGKFMTFYEYYRGYARTSRGNGRTNSSK